VKRYLPYILIAGALLALNVGKWVLGSDPAHVQEQSSQPDRVTAKDFALRVAQPGASDPAKSRDLFFAKSAPVAVRAAPRAVAPAGPPPKTPEELAQEQAAIELARLNVTGIAFRNGKGQAFVTRGEESYVVKTGDKVAERFEITAISADYVSLRDTETGMEKQITLQGN
jgi:hypothetical protein